MTAPIFPAGKETLPPGITEEEREAYFQAKKYERWMSIGMESCIAKTAIAGAGGATPQKAREIMKEMGRGMWRSGKGFGKVGALFAGIECVFESYRARNDMVNPIAAGFVAGGVLARNSGPKAVVGGGLAFAAFSAVIDLFLRREPAE
ncbi:Tim17/Tim22/Tim23/Pmp24 family-domain-containing protein [Cerioporus squamosus]|nr:Tim17/Tim22/Tim23/Pmp24 family-domain-containing protein [Cerioporus squamosus]